ncbi:MAG: MFS transporter [Bacteroidales bacterium]|jgi:FHS family L-fucose permease-like MFS transporter|nr:MFS transporter [Bacteroidales bacterium]
MKKNGNSNILAIIIMVFLFGMISFVTNLASPMGEVLENQFSINNFLGTLGVFANFIAYAVMGIPGGIMLQRFGYKKTAMTAVIVGIVGVGIQTLSGTVDNQGAYFVYLGGAFIAGFSMCLLNIVVNPMLNTLGGGGNRGNQLIQVGGTFNSLCGTAVIMLVGVLVGDIAKAKISDVYPVMFIALAVFTLALIVIGLSKIPEPHLKEHLKLIKEKSSVGPLSFRHFVLGAIGIFIYVGVEVGTPQVLNSWLVDTDLNLLEGSATTIAGFVTATYWFLMLVGRLLGVLVGSFISPKKMLASVATLGLALVLCAIFFDCTNKVNMPVLMEDTEGMLSFGMALVPINAMFLVLVGLCTSVMWGGIFNLAVNGLGKYTEKASGIFMALVCGGGILPLLQNFIVDISSYQISYWVIFAGIAYLLFYALIGSKNVNKNIVTE